MSNKDGPRFNDTPSFFNAVLKLPKVREYLMQPRFIYAPDKVYTEQTFTTSDTLQNRFEA